MFIFYEIIICGVVYITFIAYWKIKAKRLGKYWEQYMKEEEATLKQKLNL